MTDIEFKQEFEKRVKEYVNWLREAYDLALEDNEKYYHYNRGQHIPSIQQVNRRLLDSFGKAVFDFGKYYAGDIEYHGVPFDKCYPIDPLDEDMYRFLD